MRKLDSTLGVAELAVYVGQVGEALAKTKDSKGGTGGGSGEAGRCNVLEYIFHGVDEIDVEIFGVLGLVFTANGEEYFRGGVIGVGEGGEGGEGKEYEGEERRGNHRRRCYGSKRNFLEDDYYKYILTKGEFGSIFFFGTIKII